MDFSNATFLTNRNVEIIRSFKKHTKDGMKKRTAVAHVAKEVGVSSSVVNAVIYTKGYAFREEAWSKYNAEVANATKQVA